MNSSAMHAKRELKILREYHKNNGDASVIDDFHQEIIALCDKFGESGQSGASAPFVAKAISESVRKLMLFENLAPVTGEDWEWNEISEEMERKLYQNNRVSSIFKDEIGCYYNNGIVFKEESGSCFTGSFESNGLKVSSRQYIKEFPFTPKTFYVDVISYEYDDKESKELKKGGGWWDHELKAPEQLKEVYEYYNNIDNNK